MFTPQAHNSPAAHASAPHVEAQHGRRSALESLINPPAHDELPPLLPPLRNITHHESHYNSSIISAEHERTRQERLKLEQCKVKRDMLRDLLRAGVHPSQIPLFFTERGENRASRSSAPDPSSQVTQTRSVPTGNGWSFGLPSPISPHPTTSAPMQQGLPHPQSALAGLVRSSSPARLISVEDGATNRSTNQPSFCADLFSDAPRSLQFKFYKPGPKQKVLRRNRKTNTNAHNGIRKERPSHGVKAVQTSFASPRSPEVDPAGSRAEPQRSTGGRPPASSKHDEAEMTHVATVSDDDDSDEEDDEETGSDDDE